MSGKKKLKLAITITFMFLGIISAITTIVVMAHVGHRTYWENTTDTLIATPIVVCGFGMGILNFILTCIIADT